MADTPLRIGREAEIVLPDGTTTTLAAGRHHDTYPVAERLAV